MILMRRGFTSSGLLLLAVGALHAGLVVRLLTFLADVAKLVPVLALDNALVGAIRFAVPRLVVVVSSDTLWFPQRSIASRCETLMLQTPRPQKSSGCTSLMTPFGRFARYTVVQVKPVLGRPQELGTEAARSRGS